MAVKLKKIEFRSIQLGSDNRRSANGYFKDYSLEFKTINSATNLVELIKGIKLRINFGSLEIPDNENKWLYDVPGNFNNPIPENLKSELITWYKNYLNFDLVLENPIKEEDRDDYYFHLADGCKVRLNFDKNPGEDDPLNIWVPIDIRELPGFGEIKDIAWQSYDTDANDEYIGMRPKWDKKHLIESEYNEKTQEWSEKITNHLALYLNGYSLDISFKCYLEGEIQNK
ncbi:MAG: hypothetical protein JNJ41_11220 [Bacteroidia bacterium]|nr:hypothetical protein [Bacteroidia bacterium]